MTIKTGANFEAECTKCGKIFICDDINIAEKFRAAMVISESLNHKCGEAN